MPLPGEPERDAASGPATVRPTSPGPQELSDAEVEEIEVDLTTPAAPSSSEPHPGADEEASGAHEDLAEFDPKYRDEFFGLVHIGALSNTFMWLGHEFHIRTLTTEELLLVALLVKQYDDTIGASKAYSTAIVAMGLREVDGQPLPEPIGKIDPLEMARKRFQYVAQTYYAPTIDYVYSKWLELDFMVQKVVEKMGNSSG